MVPGGERQADRSILVSSITKREAHEGSLGDHLDVDAEGKEGVEGDSGFRMGSGRRWYFTLHTL